MRGFWSDERGFSVAIAASIILLTLTLFYTSYQAIEIPNYCKNVERNHLIQLESDIVRLVALSRELVTDNTPKTVYLHLGDTYPPIPFFNTPNGFSTSVSTYPARVKISNINITSVTSLGQSNPTSEIEITGSNLLITPNYLYLNSPNIIVEYGVVAMGSGEHYMSLYGKIIDNNTIFIPLFYGNLSVGGIISYELRLYPKSAGGGGVLVTNLPGKNITIELDTKLPESFWKSVVPSWVNVTKSGNTVILSLPMGRTYKLIMGVASLNEQGERLPPDYLYRISPISQSSPCGLVVQVRDLLSNPVPLSEVTFNVSAGSATLKTVDESGTLVSSGSSLSVESNEAGFASVTVESSGVSVIVASLSDRSALQPYEVAFIVS